MQKIITFLIYPRVKVTEIKSASNLLTASPSDFVHFSFFVRFNLSFKQFFIDVTSSFIDVTFSSFTDIMQHEICMYGSL